MAAEVANNQQAAAVTAAPVEDQTAGTEAAPAKAVPVADDTTVAKDEQKTDEAVAIVKTENGAEAAAPVAATPKVVAPKVTVHKADFEKDIIYLYQFSRTPLLPSLSPYCLKVETWLRLAGLKYEVSTISIFSNIVSFRISNTWEELYKYTARKS